MHTQIHMPADEQSQCAIRKQISRLYAHTAIRYIESLPASRQQKLELVNLLKQTVSAQTANG